MATHRTDDRFIALLEQLSDRELLARAGVLDARGEVTAAFDEAVELVEAGAQHPGPALHIEDAPVQNKISVKRTG